MTREYEFFDHTADVGVRVFGATLPELFAHAAAALYAAMGRFELAPEPAATRRLRLTSANLEELLHDWLADLLYDFSTGPTLYREFRFTELGPAGLTAELRGGRVDYARSETHEEIKAVTYHRLAVTRQADGSWLATVILDV